MASKDPKIREIEIEAARLAPKDMKDRFRIRNELRAAAGLGKEKSTRGGIAGTWDRNKKVITPALTTALGIINPGFSALAGGLIGGLDREGESGVGFDLGKAAVGTVKGAAMGKLGSAGEIFAKNLAKQGFKQAATSAGKSLLGRGETPNRASTQVWNEGLGKYVSAAPTPPTTFLADVNNAARGTGRFLAKNPEIIGSGLQAGAAVLNNASDSGDSGDSGDRLSFEREQWEAEQEQKKSRSLRAQRLYDLMQGQMSWNRAPSGGS